MLRLMPVNRQASGMRILIGSIDRGDEGGGEEGRAGISTNIRREW